MKKVSMFSSVLFVVLGTLLVSACGVTAPMPVAALSGTDAPAEVNTPLPLPTEELSPASPETPTPSRMELPVQNATFQVKVLDVKRSHRVDLGIDNNLGTELTFTPGAGNMFLSFGVKVSNLTGSDITMKWSDIYLTNKYQDKWYPVFGAYKDTNSAIDPFTVEILEFDQVHPDFDPDAHFYAGDNGYVRVIFRIPRDNLYYFFGFADLPLVEINWRYYQ